MLPTELVCNVILSIKSTISIVGSLLSSWEVLTIRAGAIAHLDGQSGEVGSNARTENYSIHLVK